MLVDHACPALVLNADYQPLSFYPLSVWPWKRALEAVIAGRVHQVATYDRMARSQRLALPLPSIVALRDYQRLDRPAPLTRWSVFLRDDFTCQFCGGRFATQDLTFDHVLPRSRGGVSRFDNLVAACAPCNLRKADRTPAEARMQLRRRPYHPTQADLNRVGRKYRPASCPSSWQDALYWGVELEP